MIEIAYDLSKEEPHCPICGDTGKIYIFRNDWEEFDEILCENCNKLTI